MHNFFQTLEITLPINELEYFNKFIADAEKLNEFYCPKQKLIPAQDHKNPQYDFTDSTTEIVIEKDLLTNSVLQRILQCFGPQETVIKILKFPPKYFTGWHTDITRRVGFNIPLNSYKSVTMFSEDIHSIDDRSRNTRIEELVYDLGKIYIFNASKFHSVINLDNKPRYIMAIFVLGKTGITYETAIDRLKLKNLV